MEGRGFSGFYKNSSEELFLKTVMESPIGVPVPTMEMLGFKTVSQSFRTDSEELFKRWLTNEEASYYMTYDHVALFFVVSVQARVKKIAAKKFPSFPFKSLKELLDFISVTCVYLNTYTS